MKKRKIDKNKSDKFPIKYIYIAILIIVLLIAIYLAFFTKKIQLSPAEEDPTLSTLKPFLGSGGLANDAFCGRVQSFTDMRGNVYTESSLKAMLLDNGITEVIYNEVRKSWCVSLAAYYSFDSGTAKDDTGKGNDGTIMGGAVWTVTGKKGGAFVFDGVNDYIDLNNPPPSPSRLGLPKFTLSVWFKRSGKGVSASTGTGGVSGEPLVTKGRGEADGNPKDMNYFLGIKQTGPVLAVDFESTESTNNNYPLSGVTIVSDNVWHHAAASYDGANWKLYFDGKLDNTNSPGKMPRYDSIQKVTIGSAQNSLGSPAGFFKGVIDEVRIYDGALSESEIIQLYQGSSGATPTSSPSPTSSPTPTSSPSPY